ncbi:MAG: hypothetical protein L6Q81_07495 [Bacteroidia bacterium]|nr:hypothetical protein [Bacteroidia bacterium]
MKKKITIWIFIIVGSVSLKIYFGYNSRQIAKNLIIVQSRIVSWSSAQATLNVEYEFEFQNEYYRNEIFSYTTGRFLQYLKSNNISVPTALDSTNPNRSKLLLTEGEFAEFDLDYPDTMFIHKQKSMIGQAK